MVKPDLDINKYHRSGLAIILSCLIYFGDLIPLLAQTDSIANERIPVKALQLEAHWKVDCEKSLSKAKELLSREDTNTQAPVVLIENITKCMHIYNTPNTTHYKPKPDFRTLLDKLKPLSG